MKVSVVRESPRVKRGTRQPSHPFNIQQRPWQIAPFFVAPVLPGETLKSLLCMTRSVSDPLANKLMGWWHEQYFFYVKHRDMQIGDSYVAMHLNQAETLAPTSAADRKTNHANGGVNVIAYAMNKIVEWYFRDEEEAVPGYVGADYGLLDNQFAAKVNMQGWWQSLRLGSTDDWNPAGDIDGALPGDYPGGLISEGIGVGVPAGYEAQYAQWQAMVAAGVSTATFEDYLASFGVKLQSNDESDEENKRPELIRYQREFTYPTNTVEPSTGVASSAAVWTTSLRADKDRFFKEPGFLIGVQVIRPKVMLTGITGSMAHHMNKAFDWLPALIQDRAFMSLKSFGDGAGPAPVAFGDSYWVDLRDLFLYGDQFLNHSDQVNAVALPRANGNFDYATLDEAKALFKAEAASMVRSDGVVNMSVASPVFKDTTR